MDEILEILDGLERSVGDRNNAYFSKRGYYDDKIQVARDEIVKRFCELSDKVAALQLEIAVLKSNTREMEA